MEKSAMVKKKEKSEYREESKEEKKPLREKTKELKEETSKSEQETEEKRKLFKSRGVLLFDKWDTSEVLVRDPGLKPYINLTPILIPRTQGRHIRKQFHKSKKPIVERLMNKLMISGHKSKKHWRTSGRNTGKSALLYTVIKKTFEIIESKKKENPIQVLVRAIEIGSAKEGITTIEYGGVRYPKSVDLSPQKRVDLVLRWMTQGAYVKSAGGKGKKDIWQTLADEIIATAENDQTKSNSIQKKIELERQAQASR